MQVSITGRVHDSAGVAENGRIEFSQAQRIDNGEFLITSSPAVSQVVGGELKTLSGEPFKLPSNPEGTAVRVREVLGGKTFEWWTAVPDTGHVEYRDLPLVQSDDIPSSVWGPPPWVSAVEQMKDETVSAIQIGVEVADALGGLEGINAAVASAESAASSASTNSDRASAEADRAEAAAGSIDMSEISERLDGMVEKNNIVSAVYGTDPSGNESSIPYRSSVLSGGLVQRTGTGHVSVPASPQLGSDASSKVYVDELIAGAASSLASAMGVVVTHQTADIAGGNLMNIFTVSTGGRHIPGVVNRRLADGPNPAPNDTNNLTALQSSVLTGDSFVVNGSGWTAPDGKIRGPNFIDGEAYGVLSNVHPQDNAAVAYCRDGRLRYYEHALGDTVQKMKADGVIHSWSWGPQVILNNSVFNYASSGGWSGLNTTAKSARTVLGQKTNGDLVVYQIYGVSGSSGVTVGEAAAALVGRGLRTAVLLDGGGSTQSSWGGKIAHVSSDPTSRRLPDFLSFNARKGGAMRIPPKPIALKAPFSGELLASLVDGTAIVAGNVNGNSSPNTNPQLTVDGSTPLWIRNTRGRGLVRGGGGIIGLAKFAENSIHLSSPVINNPDVYIECDAYYGME